MGLFAVREILFVLPKICQHEAISGANDFLHPPKFFASARKLQRFRGNGDYKIFIFLQTLNSNFCHSANRANVNNFNFYRPLLGKDYN